jgi:hypothetical protein
MSVPPSSGTAPDVGTGTRQPSRRLRAALSSRRRIVIVVIVVVVLGVGATAIIVVRRHDAAVTAAKQSLAQADKTLAAQFNGYTQRTTACERVANPYKCIESADRALVPHLNNYAGSLDHATSAGLAERVINAAHADADHAAKAFHMVGGAAPTKAGYTKAVARSDLFSVVDTLQNSVNAVIHQLNQG